MAWSDTGPVPASFVFLSGTGLFGCRTVWHSGIYTYEQAHEHTLAHEHALAHANTHTYYVRHEHDMHHRHGDGQAVWMPEC